MPKLLPHSTAAVVSACLCLGLVGCSQTKRDEVPPDCTVMEPFEFQTVAGLDPTRWYAVPDRSVQQGKETSVVTVVALPATDPTLPVCELTTGINFKSSGNHDWGSFIGVYHEQADMTTGVVPPLAGGDATGFEGLSFWARSLWDKGLTLELTDAMSDDEAGQCEPSAHYLNDAGMEVGEDAGTKLANPEFSDENGVPVPTACGNSFDAMLLPTERWAFYTIPFKQFRQTRQEPSLKPDGIDLANIWRLLIRAPRGAMVDAYFLNFAWYRKKPVP